MYYRFCSKGNILEFNLLRYFILDHSIYCYRLLSITIFSSSHVCLFEATSCKVASVTVNISHPSGSSRPFRRAFLCSTKQKSEIEAIFGGETPWNLFDNQLPNIGWLYCNNSFDEQYRSADRRLKPLRSMKQLLLHLVYS